MNYINVAFDLGPDIDVNGNDYDCKFRDDKIKFKLSVKN